MTSSGRPGGLARTAAPAAPHMQLPLSEELFSAVLQQCRPSRSRVEAVTQLALQHPVNAADVWTALRKALIAEIDLNSHHNQALWYVVDSLLKHATYIFQPLMAPRLLEYVIQQMPWHLVQWSASVVETSTAMPNSGTKTPAVNSHLMWCERLVRTWEQYLPPSIFQPILQHAIHCRSEAELGGALSSSHVGITREGKGKGATPTRAAEAKAHPTDPASPEQLRQLTESWQTFYYWCRALEEQQQRRAAPTWLQHVMTAAAASAADKQEASTSVAGATSSSAAEANPSSAAKHTAQSEGGDVGDEEDDDDYDPEFVNGAKPRALPQLDLPRRRREARRRPRDDDDL